MRCLRFYCNKYVLRTVAEIFPGGNISVREYLQGLSINPFGLEVNGKYVLRDSVDALADLLV